nr:MAG TPA: hypothetical protein [Caudoviricetes sp.]
MTRTMKFTSQSKPRPMVGVLLLLPLNMLSS